MAHTMQNDPTEVADSQLMAQIATQATRLAHELGELQKRAVGLNKFAAANSPPSITQFARRLVRRRRRREEVFGAEIFSDPAWDMMLDLFIAFQERQKISVSSLCIASAVPPTTALRWIKILCDRGIFVRRADEKDGRRVWIELAPHVHARMCVLLDSWC